METFFCSNTSVFDGIKSICSIGDTKALRTGESYRLHRPPEGVLPLLMQSSIIED